MQTWECVHLGLLPLCRLLQKCRYKLVFFIPQNIDFEVEGKQVFSLLRGENVGNQLLLKAASTGFRPIVLHSILAMHQACCHSPFHTQMISRPKVNILQNILKHTCMLLGSVYSSPHPNTVTHDPCFKCDEGCQTSHLGLSTVHNRAENCCF